MRTARQTSFLFTNFLAGARVALGGGGQRLDNVPLPVEYHERGIRTCGQCLKTSGRATNTSVVLQETTSPLPPSLAWFWNPSKKVIYGDLLFWYPIGNTPARNLFEGLGSASSSALLLGCGDVRNVLETCRQSKPVERKLTFALNDFNSSTIARDVLLFAIADQIDASNARDVDFLWSVWYNLRLPEEHFSRLRKVVKEILEGNREATSWLKIGGRDWEAVETVYRSWLVEGSSLPDVDDVQGLRKERILFFLKLRGQQVGENWSQQLQTDPSLLNLLDASLRKLAMKECSLYAKTGSVTRDDSGNVENFLPNVTLLHPKSRQWRNHYTSSPFPAYRSIVTDKNLRNAGGLVKACQRRLQEWVVALQARTRREPPTLELSMYCSDALEFCLCGGSSRSFDVIDTTNLADHVGLLNLVVCAGPRLANKPRSRLSTSTLTWVFNTEDLRDYVDRGLSFNSKFAPTILGLRLVTDLDAAKSSVLGQMQQLLAGNDERRLDWEPVPCPSPPINIDDRLIARSIQSNKNISLQPEPCAIGIQLSRIVKACCLLPLGTKVPDNCGLQLSSPTTLALLLRNMGSRCVLDSSGKAPVSAFSDWCKEYCVSFALEAKKVANLMDSRRGGLVEVRGALQRDQMLGVTVPSTPIVRVALVHRSLLEKSNNIEMINDALASDPKARHSGDMSLVHVIDNASVDDETDVRFLLPEDHGLEASEWQVLLIDSDRPLGMTVLSYASLKSMEQVAFKAPMHLVNQATERNGGACIDGARIYHLKEYNDRFVASLLYDSSLQNSKLFTNFDRKGLDELSLSVELAFRLVSDQSLRIDFPSPVVTCKAKRWRSRQEIECIFPKLPILSANASTTDVIEIFNLPVFEGSIGEILFQEMSFEHNVEVAMDPFYSLRNIIRILSVGFVKDGIQVFMLYDDKERQKAGKEPILSIVVMGPVTRMDGGEPALLVCYVDHAIDVEARKKAGRFDADQFIYRFVSVVLEFGTRGTNDVVVGQEEVMLLRRMLAENSVKMKPSRLQAKYAAGDSGWRPSFVKLLYPEDIEAVPVGSEKLREKVEEMLMEEELKHLESFLGGSSREAGIKVAAEASSRDVATLAGNVEVEQKEGPVATKCGNCKRIIGLKRCGGCGKIWYCGKDCQKEHWRVHKHQCGKA